MDSDMTGDTSNTQNPTGLGKKSRKRRIGRFLLKHLFLGGSALILAGLLIVLAFDRIVFPIALKSGVEVDAPQLVGVSLEIAEELAKNQNFEIMPDSTEYNNDFPANTISFQYPHAGTKIKPGRRIRVTVSLGAKPVLMPDLIGMPRRDAELTIEAMGLTLAEHEWVHSNDYLKGIVARQYPEGNQEVSGDVDIVLYISDGLPETDIIMPNLLELGLSAARDTLRIYGYHEENIQIHYEEAPELLPESIIDQHPDPGTPTNLQNPVVLIVSLSG